MKTIILISLCVCLMVSAISADKSHKHQGKLLKSGHEEHKKPADIQPLAIEESEMNLHTDQVLPVKPAGRNHRKNHHGKTKKRTNTETHTGRSRKSQSKTKPKNNGQRSHNKHGRKHGRGKQAQ